MPVLCDDRERDHHSESHQKSGDEAGHEELADRNAGDDGVEHHRDAGRDYYAYRSRGGYERC